MQSISRDISHFVPHVSVHGCKTYRKIRLKGKIKTKQTTSNKFHIEERHQWEGLVFQTSFDDIQNWNKIYVRVMQQGLKFVSNITTSFTPRLRSRGRS